MQTLRRIYAGPIVLSALSSRGSRKDTPKQRAAKRQASTAAQRQLNQLNSAQQFELILAANYPTPGSGLVVVLTYDDEHLPKSRKEAQQRFKYFLRKLRLARAAAGLPEPVVCSAPEVLTSATGRWHHHIVVDNTGNDYDMLRACWIYGSDIDITRLRVDKDKNHETLARYMTKEARECQEYDCRVGLHGWSCTRNAKRPERDTITVGDDYELTPPEDCTVLLDERKHTEFASYAVLKIRYNSVFPEPPARARRRRPKRS